MPMDVVEVIADVFLAEGTYAQGARAVVPHESADRMDLNAVLAEAEELMITMTSAARDRDFLSVSGLQELAA